MATRWLIYVVIPSVVAVAAVLFLVRSDDNGAGGDEEESVGAVGVLPDAPRVSVQVIGGDDTNGDGVADSIEVGDETEAVAVNLLLRDWVDGDGLQAYQWKLLFDPDLLEVAEDGVRHGGVFADGGACPFPTGPEVNNDEGYVTFSCLDTGNSRRTEVPFAILDSVTFNVRGKSGETTIDILCYLNTFHGPRDASGKECDRVLGTHVLDSTGGGGGNTEREDIYGDGVETVDGQKLSDLALDDGRVRVTGG